MIKFFEELRDRTLLLFIIMAAFVTDAKGWPIRDIAIPGASIAVLGVVSVCAARRFIDDHPRLFFMAESVLFTGIAVLGVAMARILADWSRPQPAEHKRGKSGCERCLEQPQADNSHDVNGGFFPALPLVLFEHVDAGRCDAENDRAFDFAAAAVGLPDVDASGAVEDSRGDRIVVVGLERSGAVGPHEHGLVFGFHAPGV